NSDALWNFSSADRHARSVRPRTEEAQTKVQAARHENRRDDCALRVLIFWAKRSDVLRIQPPGVRKSNRGEQCQFGKMGQAWQHYLHPLSLRRSLTPQQHSSTR